MAVARISKIPLEAGADHPVPAVDRCKARRKQRLGDAVGLDQFGVNRVELDPGVWSTVRHWHTHEDEFILVVEGQLTLVADSGSTDLEVGDCAGFKAGDLSPKFPPALHRVLGVESVTLGGHFVHALSLQEFHWRQVA